MKKISIVVPAFNEAENLPVLIDKISNTFKNTAYQYEIIIVDDGSKDATIKVLKEIRQSLPYLHYINLSRNFGHQNALKAGIDFSTGDCILSMDSDMQHPPELIPTFIQKWEEGYEIVYSRRLPSKKVSIFKQKTSDMFYSLVNSLSEVKLEPGTADFRLIDRKVANAIIQFNEIDPFLRGIIKWVGFSQYAIDYIPDSRHAGESKYSLKKMLKFALQGITSFSIRPLYTAVYIGFIFSGLSVAYLPYVLYNYLVGNAIQGWASIIMTIVFIGGLQLIILGIIGIYVGKIFLQTKLRPNYLVRESTLHQQLNHDLIEF